MIKFIQRLSLALHVSDLIGPSSGAFCTSCIRRLWYVVLLCVLLDTSSRCKVLGIQLVQNAPDDGPIRSETCRPNLSAD